MERFRFPNLQRAMMELVRMSNASMARTQSSPSPSPQTQAEFVSIPLLISLILCFQIFCGKIILTIM